MWDGDLVTRVRDRKLNEIMIFASLAKIDSRNVDVYVDIIVSLGDDIDACDTLLETGGEAIIVLDPLDRPEYTSRLSESERSDEDAFNSLKTEPPARTYDDALLEEVRALIMEAAGTINTGASEAEALTEELTSCRRVIDELTVENDLIRSESASSAERANRLEGENSLLNARVVELENYASTMEGLRSDLERSRSEESSLRDRLAEVVAEHERLTEEGHDLSSRLETLQSVEDENAILRERLSELEAAGFEGRIEELTGELERSRSEESSLRDRLAEVVAGHERLTEEGYDLRSRLEARESEAAEYERRIEELTGELERSRESQGALNERLSSAEADCERLEEENSELGSKLEAMAAVREELGICRGRVDSLSSDLEYARGDAQTARDQLAEAEAELERLSSENARLRSDLASARTDLNLSKQKLSVLESAFEKVSEDVRDAPAEPEPEPEEVGQPDAQENPGTFLSGDSIDMIRRVREMKDAKIDYFLDSSVTGVYDLDVCDDIVDFLKTDISVCDAILSIDFSDRGSVVSGFRSIVSTLEGSKEPVHQDVYVASLTPEEAQVEYGYSQVLNSLQGMMMYMRDDIM